MSRHRWTRQHVTRIVPRQCAVPGCAKAAPNLLICAVHWRSVRLLPERAQLVDAYRIVGAEAQDAAVQAVAHAACRQEWRDA